ncbi:hypothetical protein C5167_017986 [Papaver somniferum]|uniref:ABC transporter domain-containing protein n=1 Tax=Papaver somniferum TaxID=3469 RepID=A0A4Y7ILH4_PAPSO|nr:hypothetical protein C5167_017986 [Papaver somniferum]
MKLYQSKCEGPEKAGIRKGVEDWFRLAKQPSERFFAHVFFALIFTAVGLTSSSSMAADSSKAKHAAASVFDILDQQPKIDISNDSGRTFTTRKTIALVGESGCGKSTVISMLQRFYDPDSGRITLDGVEIQKFQVRWLRQQMGLVSQEPVLFNETIRANIGCGNVGGQKQRIAIARAVMKAPKILLFDEATSALDAESVRVVQAALDRIMVNRTTIVVAHRLTTIKNADVIAVVKNGVIAEKGDHDTLMNIKNGA